MAPFTLPSCHVERVSLAVGVKRLLVEPIGPRREQRDAVEARRLRLELVDRCERKPQNVLAFHFHLVGHHADRRDDRDRRLVLLVFELHDVAVAARVVLLCRRRNGRHTRPEHDAERQAQFVVRIGLLLQAEAEHHVAGGERDVLLAVDRITHRRCLMVTARLEVPEILSRLRIEREDVSVSDGDEDNVAPGGEHAVRQRTLIDGI